MKTSTLLLASLLAVSVALPASAQMRTLQPWPAGKALPKVTEKQKMLNEARIQAEYPFLAQKHVLPVKHSAIPMLQPVVPFRQVDGVPGKKAAGYVPTFWSVLANSDAWPVDDGGSQSLLSAVINFTPDSAPFDVSDSLVVNPKLNGSGGAALVNGVYYHFVGDLSYLNYGIVLAYLYSYDTKTWTPTAESGADMSKHLDLFANETAQAEDGTVYGQFFNSGLTRLEYGIVDYPNLTRTTIGPASEAMVAMGVTSDHHLYGIAASDGCLYEINTETGEETYVGNTGIVPSDATGYFGQTGEIDPKTNTFYWACVMPDGSSSLYTVDLKDGHATKIGDYADGKIQMFDMIMAGRQAEDDAPARATDLAVSFPNGGTTGTVSFTAPATNYAGEAISGDLSYEIKANGMEIAQGTTVAGAPVTASVTDVPEGMVKFSVTTNNDAGVSPKANMATWVGYDIPVATDTVTFSLDGSNKATVTWSAVRRGKHNSYIGDITYRVVRLADKDSVVVAESTADTTIVDQLPANAPMNNYKYAVCAINGGKKYGAYTTSEGQIVGSAFDVPYSETFDTKTSAELYTIVDANNDGSTWEYTQVQLFGTQCMRCKYSNENNMDDWLIAPGLNLKKGQEYKLSFKAGPSTKYAFEKERIEVKYGLGRDIASMTEQLVEKTDLPGDKGDSIFNVTFTPAETGIYYIGFHGCSDLGQLYLLLDDISVGIEAGDLAPASPAISAVPGAKGELTATVNITAPDKLHDGKSIPDGTLSKVVLRKNGKAIATFEKPANGELLTYHDTVSTASAYTYTAIAYCGDFYSEPVEQTIFIGPDVPLIPQHIHATDHASSVTISWDAISEKGANDGYVNPNEVTTYLYNVGSNGYLEKEPIDSVVNGTSFTVTMNTNEGTPTMKRWGVVNKNHLGKTSAASVGLPIGTPATLPFFESVADGKLANNWWMNSINGSWRDNAWSLSTADAADADGGSFLYTAKADSVECEMNTYKISLKGSSAPVLAFYHNMMATADGAKGKLEVKVVTPDGQSHTLYTSPEYTNNHPWELNLVPLSDFINEQWILVKFHATTTKASLTMGLDRIRLKDTRDDDLAVKLSATSSVLKGQTITALVNVANEGTNDQEAYSVNIITDGKPFQTIDIDRKLNAFCDTTIAVAIPTSTVMQTGDEMSIKAHAVLETDEDDSNNEAVTTTILATSEYNKPQNLKAASDKGLTILSWKAPESSTKETTDDFESYAPFVTPFGEWTTIDGNPDAKLGGFFGDYPYTGQSKPGSFVIFNLDAIHEGLYDVDGNAALRGHNDSHQFAAMPYEIRGSQEYVDGDNYLVSPKLSGEAQTISFYAKNVSSEIGEMTFDYPERFEVLASKNGNSLDDFTETVLQQTDVTGGEWTKYDVDVPAGTNYFAIHQTSSASDPGNYLLSIDDVSFRVGVMAAKAFKVYCDNMYLATVSADGTLTYQASDITEGEHTWAVTAVYDDDQESLPALLTVSDGIAAILASGQPFNVYTPDGVRVRTQVKNLNGLKAGIYIVNDHKVIVK